MSDRRDFTDDPHIKAAREKRDRGRLASLLEKRLGKERPDLPRNDIRNRSIRAAKQAVRDPSFKVIVELPPRSQDVLRSEGTTTPAKKPNWSTFASEKEPE